MRKAEPAAPGGEKRATVLAVLFWLLVWQLAAMAVRQALFLPTPLAAVAALVRLVPTAVFWNTLGASFGRIALGFVLGFVAGCLLGALAALSRTVRLLLQPLMQLIRAVPVASFSVLALLWFSRRYFSVFIGFLMVLPVIYSAVGTGLAAVDANLAEMARTFRVGRWRRFCSVLLPPLAAPLQNGAQLAVGLGWKSGVAAEVIGLLPSSIGYRLYEAKNFLLTDEVFAWTAVVVVLSFLFGRLVQTLLGAGLRALQKGVAPW